MQNDFTNIIPTLFAVGYPILEDNIVYPRTTMNYTGVATANKGDTVTVKISQARETTDISASNVLYDPAGHEKTVRHIALDNWQQSGFHLSNLEFTTFDWLDDFSQQMAEATESLARRVNTTHQDLYKESYLSVGTPGTPLFGDSGANAGINTVIAAKRILLENKAKVGDLSLFVSHEAEEDALNSAAISRADYSGDALAINEGRILRKGGANWYPIHSLDGFEHTAGMAGSPQIRGTTATAGSTSIVVDGHTGTANEGDLFTIQGNSQQYTVVRQVLLVPPLAKP